MRAGAPTERLIFSNTGKRIKGTPLTRKKKRSIRPLQKGGATYYPEGGDSPVFLLQE